jgi:hypothetical protein
MDNYTKFPNDILEALITTRFTSAQLTAVMYIVRKVNGWGKLCDVISVSKLAEETGYARNTMIGAVDDLEKMGVITIERHGFGRPSEMSVRDPKYWNKPVTSTSHVTSTSQVTVGYTPVTSTSQVPVTSRLQVPVTSRLHTKERKISKDTSQKKEEGPPLVSTREQQEELAPDSEGWHW